MESAALVLAPTVSVVAVTPVIRKRPLFAGRAKPVTVIGMPTSNPSVTNEPMVRVNPVGVAASVAAPVVLLGTIELTIDRPLFAAGVKPAAKICWPTVKPSVVNDPV